MKYILLIGCCLALSVACIREKHYGDACSKALAFVMKEVPYVFVGGEAVEYRPYYTFIEQLELYVFADEQLREHFTYGFDYCRQHPVIPLMTAYNSHDALFAANVYDPKALSWQFRDGQLHTGFSILDFQEPPVFLAAVVPLGDTGGSVPVELRMLVSRLEIRLTNPPAWITGLDVTVRNIAGKISDNYLLGDTTHITKQLFFDYEGPGTYSFGVNAFPTYTGKAASLTITPIGTAAIAPILVEDSRLHLLPGVITRLEIVYETEEKITVSIEIDGKWEVVDGGSIII